MRPTARGVGLAVAGLVLVGVGWRFGYAELAALGGAALVAVGFAVLHAAWRPQLEVTRHVDPDRVGRGEPAGVTLTVRNGARLRAANLLAHDRCGAAAVPVPVLRLRPGRDTTVDYPVPTTRRGVLRVGPLRVSRRDPLGLVTAARSHGGTATVWVHPRIHPLRAVPTGAMRSLDGRVDSVPHGSITFDSLREYVVGDELRRVHWRTSARIGELMVREQLDTSLPKLVVLLDNRAAVHRTKGGEAPTFEAACEAAASIITAAAREDVDATLLLVAGDTTPATHPLDRLAEADLTAGDLKAATDRLRQQRAGDTVIFLTGDRAQGDLGLVSALRGPYAAVVAGVFGDSDTGTGTATPATADGMVVLDATDGESFAAAWDGVRGW
ncbi:DUF58 domain-containing protein [Asanoa siamensis]|uniref:DUF58 domain-containing protein n=1 Tax=Asanoa siamensis TaxID=926357 RepID=A0ABQ4CYG0_9ACTN|nr:DUF58 domain-containing protein [Asanoa siamensis]GIF76315.1 hypothetical protein Asi02nite_58330 [Asanoa siamensis]